MSVWNIALQRRFGGDKCFNSMKIKNFLIVYKNCLQLYTCKCPFIYNASCYKRIIYLKYKLLTYIKTILWPLAFSNASLLWGKSELHFGLFPVIEVKSFVCEGVTVSEIDFPWRWIFIPLMGTTTQRRELPLKGTLPVWAVYIFQILISYWSHYLQVFSLIQ